MNAARLGKAKVERSTAKALLIYVVAERRALWVPRSVIHDDSEVFDDDANAEGNLVVQEWWAEKEGLA